MKNAIRKIFTRKVKLSDKLNALGAQCSFNWCKGQNGHMDKEYLCYEK